MLIIKVLFAQPGLSIAEQGAQGRAKLLGTSFAHYERAFREQMADRFAPGGFDPRWNIAGIILNLWGHALLERDFRDKPDWRVLTPEFLESAPGGFASALSFNGPR